MSTATHFGRTAGDYGRHRAGFPDAFFDQLALRWGGPGGPFGPRERPSPPRLVDLGTGTGTLARGFARRGWNVVGVDPATSLLATAETLDREACVRVRYVQGTAESTGLEAGAWDVVSVGQAWHWFHRVRAATEARRLLVPGGALLLAHFDWIVRPGNVAEVTETLVRRHNPAWPSPALCLGDGFGLYGRWLEDMAAAGFTELETFSFDMDVPYTHEGWRGRVRASAGVGAALPEVEVRRFDEDLAGELQRVAPGGPFVVPHRVFAALGRAVGRA